MKTDELAPSKLGIFLYSVITPFICLCGIFGNSVSLFVLNKDQFKCSFYVYLRVISTVDLILCIFLFMSGFSLGAFWWCDGWVTYHNFIATQVITFLITMSTVATVFVTIDRLIYLRNPLQRTKPKFCRRPVARLITLISIFTSTVYTLPYCFIFKVSSDDVLTTTTFFDSTFYEIYNWLDLTCSGILPAVILSVGNALLIQSIRKATKIQKRTKLKTRKTKRLRDQSKITLTLIAIVFFYLLCELPLHLTKPKTASKLFFDGNYELMMNSRKMDMFREVTTVLVSLHLSIKFILYCLFCPPFSKALKKTLCKDKSPLKTKNVKLFIIENYQFKDLHKRGKVGFDRLRNINYYYYSTEKMMQEIPKVC